MSEKINEVISETWPELKGKELSEKDGVFLLKVKGALKQYNDVSAQKDNAESEEVSIEQKFNETYGAMIEGMSETDIQMLKEAFALEVASSQTNDNLMSIVVNKEAEEKDLGKYVALWQSSQDMLNIYHNIFEPDRQKFEQAMLDGNTENFISNFKELGAQDTAFQYGEALLAFFSNDISNLRAAEEQQRKINKAQGFQYALDDINNPLILKEIKEDGSISYFNATEHAINNAKKNLDEDNIIQNILNTGNAKALKELLDNCPEVQQMMNVLEAKAETDLGLFVGKAWEKLTPDEKEMLFSLAEENPKEIIVLSEGTKDCKIFGIGDLKAKISSPQVKARASELLATDLTDSLKRLAANPLEGMDKKLGIGGEFKENLSLNLEARKQMRA